MNKDYIIQKKENLNREYRVLVGEGKGIYVIPRKNNEFVTVPTPHLAKEKGKVLSKAEEIIGRMKKNRNELHSLDLGVTKKGKVVAWEDNSAQGGNMFLSGDHLDAFKLFAKGKIRVPYVQARKGTMLQGASVAGSAGIVGHEKFAFSRDSFDKAKIKRDQGLKKIDSITNLDNVQSVKSLDKKTRKNLGVAGAFGVSGGAAIMASKRLKDFRIQSNGDPNVKNIAVLHSPKKVGGGHMAAAQATVEKLNKIHGVNARAFDTGDYGTSTFNNLLKKVVPASDYEKTVQRDPGSIFRSHLATFPKQNKVSGVLNKVKNFFTGLIAEGHSELSSEGRQLSKALRGFKPDKIVSTYFGSIPGLKDSGRAVDLVTTDYEISPFIWKTKNAGTYFTSSDAAEKTMRDAGVSADRVVNLGDVPVSAKSWPKIKTGTKVKKVVVMGGQLGLRTHEVGPAVAKHYLKKGKDVQVTILPGKSGTFARQELSRGKKKLPKNAHVWDPQLEGGGKSYMKYMAEADLIVTRPGGATTAELRSLGKPTVTFSEVPNDWKNHEGGNIRALTRTGQAKHMELPLKIDTTSKELHKIVSKSLDSVDKDYSQMLEGGKKAAKESHKNQSSVAQKILSTPSLSSKSRSLPFKAWVGTSAVAGSLGLVGAYLASKSSRK